MSKISSDVVIENIKKASIYYQEIIMQLAQNKTLPPVPSDLYDTDKSQEMASKLFEQIFEHPEKFADINLEYIHNLQKLIADSVAKFTGKKTGDQQSDLPFFDKRFRDPAWHQSIYFSFIKKYYMISADWMKKTVEQYELDNDGKKFLEFITNQFIDALSPSNFAFSNPEVIRESLESGMSNIVKGMENFLLDIKKSGSLLTISTTDTSYFKIGKNLATTKGKVILQNDLMQLICYKPKKKTHSIPIFILPPWINKYYILDLSEENSLIKWLVENNFQVFLVSWVNPTKELADKDFEDYLRQGVIEPLEYIQKLGFEKVNAAGYCIGGTLLAIALSYYKAQNINIINSATFLTTLVDFANPGEIGALINKSTIGYIENKVSEVGYLDGKYLSNSFSLIRANDLVWSYFVNNYLLGKSPVAFDILYWNSDSTNLPAKMYIYYLKNMYIDNLLISPNSVKMLGVKINLSHIDVPSFSLAAKSDHIALWKSVYEGVKLFGGDRTFCLTEAGHVAGVVNPATSNKYSHMISNSISDDPEKWLENATTLNGSWWNSWNKWLSANSGNLVKAIDYNSLPIIEPAPGSYVK
ncbi:MAG: class I poly(R)-hydroxyalkanoic acid synthase [Rickettsiaceae bacterium]|nr:class I poly(R)-hydroxyalkanoic acid synthase [Rickettsiaceae bacterium]